MIMYIHVSHYYTVEPLYSGHHWDPGGCPVYRAVLNSEVDYFCTQLYVSGMAGSALIREVSFIQSVLYREVPLPCIIAHFWTTI